MDQSLESALGQQNRRLFLFGAFLVLLSLPVIFLFLGNAVELKVKPQEAAENYSVSVLSGIVIPYLEKQLVLSESVVFELSSPGFETETVKYSKSSGESELIIEMASLPGTVEVEVQTAFQFVLRVPELDIESREKNSVFSIQRGLCVFELQGGQLEPWVEEQFVEGRGKVQKIVIRPERIGAQLAFEVVPKQARVEILGKVWENQSGDYQIRLPAGRHELRVSTRGYEAFIKQIAVSKSQELSLGLVSLVPSLVSFDLRSAPSGAAVLLDGNFVGETPLKLALKPLRSYDLKLSRAGFTAIRTSIEPSVGRSLVKKYNFAQSQHGIRLSSSPVAMISLNGTPNGITPKALIVSEGDRVILRAEGYAEEAFTVGASHLDLKQNHVNLIKKERKAFVDSADQKTVEGLKLRRFKGGSNFEVNVAGVLSGDFKVPDFYISETEVTAAVFSEFLGSEVKGAARENPVTGVSWEDAIRFCNWLSQKEGLLPFYRFDSVGGVEIGSIDLKANGYRLPTFVEWLFLVTDGKGLIAAPYSSGIDPNRLSRGIGNIAGRERSTKAGYYFQDYQDGYLELAPVGSFRPSASGISDLVGNVREWLHNTAAPSDEYFGSGYGMEHMVVGSSFLSGKEADLKSAVNTKALFAEEDLGFRVLRVIR